MPTEEGVEEVFAKGTSTESCSDETAKTKNFHRRSVFLIPVPYIYNRYILLVIITHLII